MQRIRLEKQMSQEEVAEGSGPHPNNIGSAKRGERNTSICDIARIARALGITMSELLAEAETQQEFQGE